MQNVLGKGRRDSTNRTPVRPVRIADDLWEPIVAAAKARNESASQWVRTACARRIRVQKKT
jgi:hypothetical protein